MRLRRIFGALFRAVLVVAVVLIPAMLLPDATPASLEMSIIIGSIAGAVVLFEYGSSSPGIIDFRFAAPYNRARLIAFAFVLSALSFLCRALTGTGAFAPDYLAFTDRLIEALSFPYSPVLLAPLAVVGADNPELAGIVQRAAALGLSVSGAAALLMFLVLGLLRWPPRRQKFNLWVNLPTFKPSTGRSVERRLFFRAVLYIFLGLSLPFTLTVLASQSLGWFDPAALASYPTLVWSIALWSFLPAAFIIRGVALCKIGFLVRRARSYG
ncbi:MAG: hypothetical protein AAGC92_01525 [Pseudomonadota bacterium]